MSKREREEALLTKKRKAAKVGDRGDRKKMRLEELCVAQDERLKKVEEMFTKLHVRVAFFPFVVPPASK